MTRTTRIVTNAPSINIDLSRHTVEVISDCFTCDGPGNSGPPSNSLLGEEIIDDALLDEDGNYLLEE